jgi:hypothetical protein
MGVRLYGVLVFKSSVWRINSSVVDPDLVDPKLIGLLDPDADP